MKNKLKKVVAYVLSFMMLFTMSAMNIGSVSAASTGSITLNVAQHDIGATTFSVLGDVEGKNCIMIDDMIDTGGTIVAGIDMLLEKGAKNVFVACTHPVFSGPAVERLKNCSAKEVVVTDTIILPEEKKFDKLKVVSVASLLAKTIENIENNLPVSEVFQEFDFEK